MCKGKEGEKPLTSSITNSSTATCKPDTHDEIKNTVETKMGIDPVRWRFGPIEGERMKNY